VFDEEAILRRLARRPDDRWPLEFLEAAGSYPEFPRAEELRSGYGKDAPREPVE
jgi:hypothetical protein